jgi:serine/threonine protein phosphatase PrpC
VGYGVAAGLIDPDAAIHHDDRHYLSNHLGASDMHIEVGSKLRLAKRDTLLLATDGLVDNLLMGEIVELIRRGPLQKAAHTLAQRCARRMSEAGNEKMNTPAKPDDATFILHRQSTSRSVVSGGSKIGGRPA